MYHDRIDLTLPQATLQQVLGSLASVGAALSPLASVSLAERKRLAKLGLKNEALALQIIEVGRSNPELIPRGIDFEKIDRDLVAREQLRSLKLLLEALLGKVNDSMLLTGVDLYAAALSIYHCLRRHGTEGGLRETVDELKRGFARPSRKKKQVEQEAAPAAIPQQALLQPITTAAAPAGTAPAAPSGVPVTAQERHTPPSPSPHRDDRRVADSSLHFVPCQRPSVFSGGFTWSLDSYMPPESARHYSNCLILPVLQGA